jgi:hypothetical protein
MNKEKVGEGHGMYGLNRNAYRGFKRKETTWKTRECMGG